jgi:hypothetical protein
MLLHLFWFVWNAVVPLLAACLWFHKGKHIHHCVPVTYHTAHCAVVGPSCCPGFWLSGLAYCLAAWGHACRTIFSLIHLGFRSAELPLVAGTVAHVLQPLVAEHPAEMQFLCCLGSWFHGALSTLITGQLPASHPPCVFAFPCQARCLNRGWACRRHNRVGKKR